MKILFFLMISTLFYSTLFSQTDKSVQSIRDRNLLIYDFIDAYQKDINNTINTGATQYNLKKISQYFSPGAIVYNTDSIPLLLSKTEQKLELKYKDFLLRVCDEELQIQRLSIQIENISKYNNGVLVNLVKSFERSINFVKYSLKAQLYITIEGDSLKINEIKLFNYNEELFYVILSQSWKNVEEAVSFMNTSPYYYLAPIGVLKDVSIERYYVCISKHDVEISAKKEMDKLFKDWHFKFFYVNDSDYELVYVK